MPTYLLADALHLDGELPVQAAIDKIVVTGCPIAVQAKFVDVYDEQVARHGSLDVERAGLRIATSKSTDVMFIGSTSIYRRGVDGVTRFNRENRLIHG